MSKVELARFVCAFMGAMIGVSLARGADATTHNLLLGVGVVVGMFVPTFYNAIRNR